MEWDPVVNAGLVSTMYVCPWALNVPTIFVGMFLAAATMKCFHLLASSPVYSTSVISLISASVMAFLAEFRVAMDDAGAMVFVYFVA